MLRAKPRNIAMKCLKILALATAFTKTIIIGLLFVSLLPNTARAASCPPEITAYWQLNENNVATFADYCGTIDGICGGGNCPSPVAGKISIGQQFTSDLTTGLEMPGNAFDWSSTDSFSIEYWMKKEAATLSVEEAVISRTETTGAMEWRTGLWSSGAASFVLIAANGDGSDPSQYLQGTTNLADGNWHHIVAIRDGLLGENRIYVDGNLEDAKPVTYFDGFIASDGAPLNIGRSQTSYYSGIADEIAIYNRVLEEQEIRAHYYLVRKYHALCSAPVKIMPLGDSITAGFSSGVDDPDFQISYRKDLWDSLIGADYYIDYVGSQVTGQGYDNFDPDNEGHPGWTASSLADQTYNWASTYHPDIILLHAGTVTVDPSPADIERILDEIDLYSKDVTVVLARIINRYPYSQTTTDFNNNVEALVTSRLAAGDKIIYVDQENGAGLTYALYPAGDIWDDVHPYATGYTKMAAVWQTALTDFLPVCPAGPPLIISDPILEASVGNFYTYSVEATGVPAPTYSLDIAPNDMTIPLESGEIEWTPSTIGDFDVTVMANNSEGIDLQSFTINVVEAPLNLTDNLLALYHFDYTDTESDQLVLDFSTYGNNATCDPTTAACPTWTASGKFGGAFSYDGANDNFTVPDGTIWDVADFSVAAWVNISSYTGLDMHIWGHRGATSSSRALWLYVNDSGNRITFRRNDVDLLASADTLSTSTWHHIAVTYTAATGEALLYIDGTLADNAVQIGELYPTSNEVDMGLRTAKGDCPFLGAIDELALWDKPLTADHITELYNLTTGIGVELCADGETALCYTGPDGTEGVGICQAGIATCTSGQWSVCVGEIVPETEICADGLDNDCNGEIDDSAICCTPGETRQCGTDVGACEFGSETCGPDAKWDGICVDGILPSTEVCDDTIDNDCDGQTDECVTGYYFPPPVEGLENQDQRLPAEVGLNSEIVNDLNEKATGWALWRHGYLVHVEGDFNSNGAMQSLRKTVHALTVGAGINQGKIPSYDQKISFWQTELTGKDADATWWHVMTQSAGFDYPGCGDDNDYNPGEMWTYSDLNLFHLCNAIAKSYGKTDYYDQYEDVVGEAIFNSIGMQGWSTETRADGIRFNFDMEDMGRLGLLLMARGNWENNSIVPQWFIEELESKQSYGMMANYQGCNDGYVYLDPLLFPESPYGYLTWVNSAGDYYPDSDTNWAWALGYAGQLIMWNHTNGIVYVAKNAQEGATLFNNQLPLPPFTNGIPYMIEKNIIGPNPLVN